MAQTKNKLVGGSKPKPAPKTDTANQSDFDAPVSTGPKAPENANPLTGSIFFPQGCGVHEIIQKNGQPKLVGFTFVLEETPQPISFVMSKADAGQMESMLAKVLGKSQ